MAGDPLQLGRQQVGIAKILVEGALGAHRLVRPVGLDLALVDPAADAPIPFGRASEMRLQLRQRPCSQVRAGVDPQPLHLGRRHRADTVEARDRQRSDEARAFFRRDDAQAVGLAVVGGELGDELAIGNAGRGGELAFLANPAANVFGDGAGAAQPMAVLRDVEIGLVEAQRFD